MCQRRPPKAEAFNPYQRCGPYSCWRFLVEATGLLEAIPGIPLAGNMVRATEELIERHNPDWKLGGSLRPRKLSISTRNWLKCWPPASPAVSFRFRIGYLRS